MGLGWNLAVQGDSVSHWQRLGGRFSQIGALLSQLVFEPMWKRDGWRHHVANRPCPLRGQVGFFGIEIGAFLAELEIFKCFLGIGCDYGRR